MLIWKTHEEKIIYKIYVSFERDRESKKYSEKTQINHMHE